MAYLRLCPYGPSPILIADNTLEYRAIFAWGNEKAGMRVIYEGTLRHLHSRRSEKNVLCRIYEHLWQQYDSYKSE